MSTNQRPFNRSEVERTLAKFNFSTSAKCSFWDVADDQTLGLSQQVPMAESTRLNLIDAEKGAADPCQGVSENQLIHKRKSLRQKRSASLDLDFPNQQVRKNQKKIQTSRLGNSSNTKRRRTGTILTNTHIDVDVGKDKQECVGLPVPATQKSPFGGCDLSLGTMARGEINTFNDQRKSQTSGLLTEKANQRKKAAANQAKMSISQQDSMDQSQFDNNSGNYTQVLHNVSEVQCVGLLKEAWLHVRKISLSDVSDSFEKQRRRTLTVLQSMEQDFSGLDGRDQCCIQDIQELVADQSDVTLRQEIRRTKLLLQKVIKQIATNKAELMRKRAPVSASPVGDSEVSSHIMELMDFISGDKRPSAPDTDYQF